MENAKKVLFIEDEDELVNLVKMRLGTAGYNVISAFDGLEGLEMARRERPDLILLDIVLPKKDGLEVCRTLKNDPLTCEIPILVVTASGVAELPQKCREAGAQDFIYKPFEAQELLARISKLLSV